MKKKIVDTLRDMGRFSRFIKAIEEISDVPNLLTEEGPFTVFAPLNEAFEALSAQEYNQLMSDTEKLRAVLLYHISPQQYTIAQIVNRHTIKTMNRKIIKVHIKVDKIFLNGFEIIISDIEAENGIIHAINGILIPQ